VVTMGIAALLLQVGPGPSWRAVGSDRLRARTSGLRPLGVEITVLGVAGLMAASSGALAAHISRVATPESFAPDVAALPLLAALAAGRQPIGAGLVAIATGLVGEVVLPALGWEGPPSADALALGILAVAALFTLLPGGGAAEEGRDASVDPDAPWPLEALGLHGGSLRADPLTLRAGGGQVLVEAPTFTAGPGTVTALVGPNGAGKTTLLRALDERAGRRRGVEVLRDGRQGRLVLLPQEGGGFGSCSVRETLELAARGKGRSREAARQLADEWIQRLGLGSSSGLLCAELSAGQRRLVDLARVLLGAPDVLLCDEPLAGLDDNHRAAATACLRAAASAGATIVLSEHDREAVATLASTVIELERRA
jgi:ABC-type Mn2+/Zn2+ transport system ATPase subunit